MPDLPRLTIVTPSFNQAVYLEQTIRSVIEQEYPNLEYFVIDGASTDGSVEIIRRYADQLAGWVSEPDRGQAEAINKGLSRATGEIIAWINSDDYYLPGAFTAAIRALEQERTLGMVYGDVLSVDAKGQPINVMRYEDWGLEGLLRFQIIGQPAVFMRRAALERAGLLDLHYHMMLDHQLWLRLAQVAPPRHLVGLWAAARFHAEAKNVAKPEAFAREALEVVEWMQTQPTLAARFQADRQRILAGVERVNGYYLSEGGKFTQSLGAYVRCFRHHPATALQDWKRVGYTLVSLVDGGWLRRAYDRQRQANAIKSIKAESPIHGK